MAETRRALTRLRPIVVSALTTLLAPVSLAWAEFANPQGMAVIVDNRDYKNERVPAVAHAHRDAEAFGATCSMCWVATEISE